MRIAAWKKAWAAALGASVCAASLVSIALAAEDEVKPNHTIKEVMKLAHKKGDSLLDKVVAGEASAEDKAMLLDLYISLVENTPKKGEADSWQKLAGGLELAAAKVVVGREGATEELKKASDCAACHKPHK